MVAVGWPGEGVFDVRLAFEARSRALCRNSSNASPVWSDPAEVRVVLETRRRPPVERLLEAGYVVLLVNPDLVACCAGWREER